MRHEVECGGALAPMKKPTTTHELAAPAERILSYFLMMFFWCNSVNLVDGSILGRNGRWCGVTGDGVDEWSRLPALKEGRVRN